MVSYQMAVRDAGTISALEDEEHFSKNDFKMILTFSREIAEDWKKFGIFLEISPDMLNNIDQKLSSQNKLIEVIDLWLKGNTCEGSDGIPTPSKLAEAVELCGYKTIARNVRRKYGLQSASTGRQDSVGTQLSSQTSFMKSLCCPFKLRRSSSDYSVTLQRVSNPCDSIEHHPSYHGEISAKKANSILKKKGGCCYLSRISRSYRCFILCVRYPKFGIYTIKHFGIIVKGKKVHLDSTHDIKEFEDFFELISYYEKNSVTTGIGTIGEMCPSLEYKIQTLESTV